MKHSESPSGQEALVECEPEPSAAALLFGEGINTVRSFATDLFERGEQLGLIGPLEPARLWSRHLINSVLAAPFLAGSVADIGSGGGFPGIPLAIARPDVEFTLIEPMERRSAWLEEQAEKLELSNVTVVRARAEDFEPKGTFDQVTARAVSALSKLIPSTAPLLKPGGEMLFLKGHSVDQEILKAEKVMKRFGVTNPSVREIGGEHGTESTKLFTAKLRA